ncbi:hypothetical protein ET475_11900 [Microbacterium protaetiae]|uniref:Asl1-like glycosyl hydrolase catalytic domain-containing protein n=1 Tax=Microbacterium protaetiae TaxID=2509458 RepID=A0A4V0YDG4_9MICO|nr:glycosyl hydrolase [Microbacterium protaetiae]QAY60621.1 hypothetical protein ET475_11900 [Microbacterium protaetiae]
MPHRRARFLVALCALAATITGCTAVSTPSPKPTSATPTPTPTPTAEAAPQRQPTRVAAAAGSFENWSAASNHTVGEVGPAVGLATSGTVAAMVDAPVLASGGATVLSTTVALVAGSTYTFSAQMQPLTESLEAGALTATVSDTKIASPALPVSTWTEVTGSVTVPASAKKGELKIALSVPARRVMIDDVSLTAADGTQLVKNGSFEKVSGGALIDNTSLIMSTDYATVAVAAPAGAVQWKATRPDGTVTGQGTITASGSLSAIPLIGVPQGFYSLTVKDAKGHTATTPMGVVDTPAYDIPLDPRFGTTVHLKEEGSRGQARYAGMLGIGTIRSDVLWRLNETTRGTYSWDKRYESEFARAHASGLQLSAIVNYGNQVYGNPVVPTGPDEIAAYGKYAAAVASHYKPTSIEIFNEFNQERFNKNACGITADCYMALVKSVNKNVRAVDPKITLIGGATANYPSSWFDRLWSLGGLKYVDAMSFHPYQANSHPETVASLIADAHKVSANHNGGKALPVWITETGSSSKTGGRTPTNQGQFLMKILSSELAAGAASAMWYDLKNTTTNAADHEGNFGLYEYQSRQNTAALAPKPTAYDQALLIASLNGRASAGTVKPGKNVVAQAFGKDDSRVYVVWTTDAKPSTASLPASGPVDVVASDGSFTTIQPSAGKVSVTVPNVPVLVRPSTLDKEPATTTVK